MPMNRYDETLSTRIDSTIKEEFSQIAHHKRLHPSELLRQMIVRKVNDARRKASA